MPLLHAPSRLAFTPSIAHLCSLIALTSLLTGCSSPIRQPSAVPAKAAAQPAPLASAAAVQAEPVIDTVVEPVLVAPASLPPLTEQALAPRKDPDAYAERDSARELARELASSHQLDPQWVWAAISQARHIESVTRLMMPASSPSAKNWAAYRSRFIEPQRIKAGARFWREHEDALQRAQDTYGVPVDIVAGVIGVETIYGRHMGTYRVLDALTTLTLDFPRGRSDRSAFFRQELGEFLVMCREQGLEPTQVRGSYAGAIGWPQFMPSSIRKFAVDFDGDGRIDLINSPVDAIGSVAHFLSAHGWRTGWPTHFDVTPPPEGPQRETLLGPDIRPTFSASEMTELGATLQDSAREHPGQLALVLLHNAGKAPTLIAGTENFYAITRYNQSSYYALAVIQLGQAVGKQGLRTNARP